MEPLSTILLGGVAMTTIDLNAYDLTDEQAIQVRKTLARRLNDRMKVLKKHGITFGAVEKYNLLIRDYYGGKRITQGVRPTSGISPQAEVQKIQDILNTPTSSYNNVRKIAQKRMATMEERYGIKFENVDDYIGFWEYESWKNLSSVLGSKDAIRAIATRKRGMTEVLEDAEEYASKSDVSGILESFGFDSRVGVLRAISSMERDRNESLKQKNHARKRRNI